jgi:hypothetical protein
MIFEDGEQRLYTRANPAVPGALGVLSAEGLLRASRLTKSATSVRVTAWFAHQRRQQNEPRMWSIQSDPRHGSERDLSPKFSNGATGRPQRTMAQVPEAAEDILRKSARTL